MEVRKVENGENAEKNDNEDARNDVKPSKTEAEWLEACPVDYLGCIARKVENGEFKYASAEGVKCIPSNLALTVNVTMVTTGTKTTTLVDCGASYSLINEEWANKLKVDTVRGITCRLTGADGAQIQTKGFTMLEFQLGRLNFKQAFHVVSGLSCPLVLGLDFLNTNRVLIDFADGTMVFRNINNVGWSVQTPKVEKDGFNMAIINREVGMDQPALPFLEYHNEQWMQLQNDDLDDYAEDDESKLFPIQERKVEDISSIEIGNDISQSTKQQTLDLINKFSGCFSWDGKVKPTTAATFKMNVFPTKPVRAAPRRRSQADHDEIAEQVLQMVEDDILEPTSSPWISELVLCQKRGTTKRRLAVDFRKINEATEDESQVLPVVTDLLEAAAGHKYYCVIDMQSAYWAIPVDEESKQYLGIRVRDQHYTFKRMPFGAKNAGTVYCRMISKVLNGMTYKMLVYYMDDIIIWGDTEDEMLERLKEVLERFQKVDLQIKPSKCKLFQRTARFVGHEISEKGIAADPERLASIRNYELPMTVKKMRSFLGLASFLRGFAPNLTEIVAPLRAAANEKGGKIRWTPERLDTFEKVKNMFLQPPVLKAPDFNKPFVLYTDASNVGIGALLCQEQGGSLRLIASANRTLNKTERRYSTIHREALAIHWAICKKFRCYLQNMRFQLRTDHEPLIWLQTMKDPSQKLFRWLLELQEFKFDVVHVPGRNQYADALTRCFPEVETEEPPVPGIINMITRECFQLDMDALLAEQRNDDELRPVIEAKEKGEYLVEGTWQTKHTAKDLSEIVADPNRNGVWCKKMATGELAIIVPKKLRPLVLFHAHDSPTAAHIGYRKAIRRIRSQFWWAGMLSDVRIHCQGCASCQLRKASTIATKGPLKPLESMYPFELISIDFVGPLPKTKGGRRWILTIVDHFTKWPEAYATRDRSAATVKNCLLDYFSRHGVCQRLLSDRGAEFESDLIDKLCEAYGTSKARTSVYTPWANGMCERFNRVIGDMLATMASKWRKDWDIYLPLALNAYRSTVHEATGQTPYMMVHGRQMQQPHYWLAGVENAKESAEPHEYVQSLQEQLRSVWDDATLALQAARLKREQQYNKSAAEPNRFKVGDKVRKLVDVRANGKFADRFEGPFEVIDVPIEGNHVWIRNNEGEKKSVNVRKLIHWHERPSNTCLFEASSQAIVPVIEHRMVRVERKSVTPNRTCQQLAPATSDRNEDEPPRVSEPPSPARVERVENESQDSDEETEDMPRTRLPRERRPPTWMTNGQWVLSVIDRVATALVVIGGAAR